MPHLTCTSVPCFDSKPIKHVPCFKASWHKSTRAEQRHDMGKRRAKAIPLWWCGRRDEFLKRERTRERVLGPRTKDEDDASEREMLGAAMASVLEA